MSGSSRDTSSSDRVREHTDPELEFPLCFELNGETQRLTGPLSIDRLLDRFGLAGRRVAVAQNGNVVPRSRFAQVGVCEGDRIEIIHAVGGG